MAAANPRQNLRILLIAQSDQTQIEVARAFTNRTMQFQLDWITQPELASSRARTWLPQVVLVDDELGSADLLRVIAALVQQIPKAAIVPMLGPESMTQAQRVVLAGARGFVTKPIDENELLETITQLVLNTGQDSDSNQIGMPVDGGVIAYVAPKGGTGRTTVAVNTAISVHRLTDASVAMVDADFSAPALDVVLNLNTERTIEDVVDRLSRLDAEMLDRMMAQHASGIHVLPAPPPEMNQQSISLPQVQEIMTHLRRRYSWIFLDIGLPLDETAYAFLATADRIVMTVLPEMVGLRNTRLMLDSLVAHGHPESQVWIVLNRANIRGGINRSDIEKRLHVRVQHTVPDDQPLASLSINRGVPLVMSHERSAVAKSLHGLAQMLVAPGSEKVVPADSRFSFLSGSILSRWLRMVRSEGVRIPS